MGSKILLDGPITEFDEKDLAAIISAQHFQNKFQKHVGENKHNKNLSSLVDFTKGGFGIRNLHSPIGLPIKSVTHLQDARRFVSFRYTKRGMAFLNSLISIRLSSLPKKLWIIFKRENNLKNLRLPSIDLIED